MKELNSANLKRTAIKRKIGTGAVYTALAVWALIVLFPFYWMIITSLKSYGSYNSENVPTLFPTSPTFENYVKAFSDVPLARYLRSILRTASAPLMWLAVFIAFMLLSRIANEVTVISFVGFIGNLIGALFFKLARVRDDGRA